MTHILAIDQGTTSSRAIVFDGKMAITASAQEEFPQHFPQSGWVEHDPADLWASVAATCRAAIEKAGNPTIAAIGITNQRETTLVWDRQTGKPIHNAIVWQDRRTADFCRELEAAGHAPMITERTGLLVDPYFSATKLKWILDHVDGARDRAEAGELLFGTVDSWLIWNLTGGQVHATDATNAARTMLYDIHKGRWSRTISDLFGIPLKMLPDVRDCSDDFGTTRPDLFGRPIPITGVAGDQQAATVGQACFKPGMMKSTYGTGCFALLNTGDTPVTSTKRLLTTIAYQLDGKPTYALEGSIFIAGAVVQWLRDGLQIIRHAAETQTLGRNRRSRAAGDPGPGLHRSWRPLLAARLPRRHLWADPQFRSRRICPRRIGERRFPDPRPVGGDEGRLAGQGRNRPARRWRDERVRLGHAVPVRHPGRTGRPSPRDRNHGAWRGLAGGAEMRDLSRRPGLCR